MKPKYKPRGLLESSSGAACDKRDGYINERQAAEYLGVSEDTLYRYRTGKSDFYRSRGPKVKMIGPRQPRYKHTWLDEWVEQRTVEFTSPCRIDK